MMQWLPIAKAPRDGTVVALWHKVGHMMPDCWWVPEDSCWSCALDDEDFSHFMVIEDPQ